jgi:endonuclease/exonuclease/phosphatase (EEP) superfamily protein YafD
MEPSSGGERTTLGFLKRLLTAAIALAVLGLAAAWVVAWIPVWPCTLLEHFRVQYVVGGGALVAVAVAMRMRGWSDAAAIATLLHGLPVAADLIRSPQAGPAGGAAIRVLLLNVHTESSGFEQVRQLIGDEQPDLIALVEVDARWIAGVAPAVRDFSGQIEHPRSDNFGVALYARGQVTGAIESLGSSLPSVVADVAIRGARMRVLLTHPMPPVSGGAYEEQEHQLAAVAERTRASAGLMLVMGDFNATPWSRLFARLQRDTGLCDSRAGFGVQASFPAGMAVMRIPIDHLLASCSIGVRDRRIGRDVGSDHLPVIADLVVPE